jgi:tRNA(adenine34) deaminase
VQIAEWKKVDHLYYMKQALKEAEKAGEKDEVPVGCVVVKDGKIIARGYNLIRTKKDPSAHAEIVAIRKACKKLKNERLNGVILYVNIEPCPMCAGAILLARLKTLVYGADDPKTGACGSVFSVINDNRNNHQVELISGVLKKECGEIVSNFFKNKRKK